MSNVKIQKNIQGIDFFLGLPAAWRNMLKIKTYEQQKLSKVNTLQKIML